MLAAEGDEEITAFQDVGLIESLLLTGNIVAATQRAVRLIDVVDRFGDDHLLPTTVRRLLAVAPKPSVTARPASGGFTRPGHAPTCIGSCRSRRLSLRSMPAVRLTIGPRTEQRRADVSARLDEVLGVLSRPLFRHGRDSGEP